MRSKSSRTSRPRSPTRADDHHVGIGLSRDLTEKNTLADPAGCEEPDALSFADGGERVEGPDAEGQGLIDRWSVERGRRWTVHGPEVLFDRRTVVDGVSQPIEDAPEEGFSPHRIASAFGSRRTSALRVPSPDTVAYGMTSTSS